MYLGAMKSIKLLEIVVFIIIGPVVESVRLPGVIVPPFKRYNETATLECPFDIENSRIYSIKWYKDGEEFFKILPKYNHHIITHAVEGVHVVLSESDQKILTLTRLVASSSGLYKCEVTADGPQFVSVQGEGRMTVIHEPKESPQISGKVQEEYEVGDSLALNCTTDESFPPATVSWFINDVPIKNGHGVHTISITPRNDDGTPAPPRPTSSVSTLNITLEPSHFTEDGEAKVRCQASITTLFWEDGSETIVGNQRNRLGAESRSTINLAPSFHDFKEAELLVRGNGLALRSNCWTVNLLTMIVLLVLYIKPIFSYS